LSNLKLGKNYTEAEQKIYRNTMFKLIRSNTKIKISPPQIAVLRWHSIHSSIMSHAILGLYTASVEGQWSMIKDYAHRVKGQGHSLKYCISNQTTDTVGPLHQFYYNLT